MPSKPMRSATRRATAPYSSGVTSRLNGTTSRTRHASSRCLCVECSAQSVGNARRTSSRRPAWNSS
ncbi:MAG: hypothetical protein K2G53_06030 [Muribaculaceae bacterium]|nr:hypothetical protein [Muribaculaceae bacterium]